MKKFSLILLLFLVFTNLSVFTQEQEVTKGTSNEKVELPKFYIHPKYPVNLAFAYKRSETTKVTQIFSDSTTRSYDRTVNIYFTLYAPGREIEGVTKLSVTIDSLEYLFVTGKDTVKYNSQDDEAVPPFNFQDYEASSIVLGKEFHFYYSPYWDFGKIDGEKLAEVRRYVNDPSNGIKDSLRNYIWNYHLSDEYLSNIVDVMKNLMPIRNIDTATQINIPFKIDIDEIKLIDTTAKYKLTEISSVLNTLTCKINHLTNREKKIRIFEFGRLVDVLDCDGTGSYELQVTPQGRVDGAKGKFNIIMHVKDMHEIIKEKIDDEINYQLMRNYKI
jgi:hypothetical protein